MKKRLLSLMLVFCTVFSVFPIQADVAVAQSTSQDVAIQDTVADNQPLTEANDENPTNVPGNKASNPFIDVPIWEWYHDAVLYVYENKLFSGTGETTFSPNDTMNRGMYVTVLGRMSGYTPSVHTRSSFADVAADAYYSPYVAWAVEKGIAKGVSESEFNPNGFVSRQQMAAFIVRLFDSFGYYYPAASIKTIPNDFNQIADYAKDAVMKLWSCGIFVGYDGNFDPDKNASRAEAAALLMRVDGLTRSSYRINYGSSDNKTGSSDDAGKTVTTYYEVKFELGAGQDATGVTLPQTKTYKSGTKIASLPTPFKQNSIFLGWYYDAAMQNGVQSSDVINNNMTLYAKMSEVSANFAPSDSPSYLTKNDVGTDFTFFVKASSVDEVKSALTIINITATNMKVSYNVEKSGDYYIVTAAYTAGQTYKATLSEGSTVVFCDQGIEQPASVRTMNFITAKAEVENLKLSGEIKYLPADSISNMTGTALDGLITLNVKSGSSESRENKYNGTFVYTGTDIAVGDTVAVYAGIRPDLRTKDTPEDENGAVAYVKITAVNGTTYTYSSSDTKEVLFKPDVLPVDVTADTDGDLNNNSITVSAETMDFSGDEYTIYSLDSQTSVDVGDFIGFYNGAFGQEGATISHYGRITGVQRDANNKYIITYVNAGEEDVISSMDIYHSREEEVELTQEQISEMENSIEEQAIDSGFVEESVKYLTALALETDGFNELSEDVNLKTLSIDTADGMQLTEGRMALMDGGSRVEITKKEVSATVAAGKVLQHFDGSYGIRAELSLNFVAEVSPKKDSDNKIEIAVQAIFEEEILLSTNISGGAVWKWAWIIPYIYDYNLNANFDVGTFTGIGITATAKTVGADDDDGYDWKPVTGNTFESKIINIGKQITDLMNAKEEFLGEKLVDKDGEEVEWSGTNGGGLAQKYSKMLENADESWIELFRKEIFSVEGFIDPFHILCYGISADFVVSANMYVTMGMTFEYANAKRYNFSLMLFHKKSTNETIDLEEAHYQFDFYVMGTLGVRAGIELEVAVGLFSLKLDSIGITAELGAYAQMWGYFYYHLEWRKSEGRNSNGSGAMFVEIGAYLKITFKAQLFSSEKLTYQPTLFDKQWPLFTIGRADNVFDFAYPEDDDSLIYRIMRTKTLTLPSSIFDMTYMDMKTGEVYDGEDNPAKNYNDATESNFDISFTNSSFSYDPATDTVTIAPKSNASTAYSEMNIVWKNATLAFSSRPLKRTIKIYWENPPSGNLITFEVAGGKYVDTIFAKAGSAISRPEDPIKMGYSFGGWYADKNLQSPYVFPSVMSKVDTVLYAKWVPATNIKYTIEHYQQNINNADQYTLADSETFNNGVTDSTIYPEVKSYEGFATPQKKELLILPNGSAKLQYFYSRNSYKLIFDRGAIASESDENAELTLKFGENIFAPILAMPGYTFLGYDSDVPATMPGNDLKFTARWQANPDTPYRIESYIQNITDNGYSLGKIETPAGTTGTLLQISNLSPVSGNGLKFTKATVNGVEVTSVPIAGDGTLVIKLYYNRNNFNVLYHVENGTDNTVTYRFGAIITEPDVPARVGYTFSGWFSDSGRTQPFSFGNSMPDKNVEIYGKLIPNTNTAYTVNHYVENLTGTYDLSKTDNLTGTTDVTLTLANLKSGSILVANGISYKEAKVGASVQTTAAILGNGSLVVNLYYSREAHTLTFDANNLKAKGGTTDTVKFGASINAPTVTLAGYTFGGWYGNPACTGDQITIPDTMPAQDFIVYAKWIANTNTAYKVNHYVENLAGTYDLTKTDNLTGTTDVTLTLADLKSSSILVANGISYKEAKVGESVETSAAISGDGSLVVNLYYSREAHTLTFDANNVKAAGGTTDTVKYGAAVNAPTVTLAGYTFGGWYQGAACTGDQITIPDTMPAQDFIVYAKWIANTNTAYKVNHYVENLAGTYDLTKTDNLTGTTDVTLTLADLKSSSILIANAITYKEAKVGESVETSAAISGDGNLVVNLYYSREAHTLTFDANNVKAAGGTTDTVKYGATISIPTVTLAGYTFGGWYDNGDCTGDRITIPNTMPAQDFVVYAEWIANTDTPYKVEHYWQNANDDGYSKVETENLTGTTDSTATAIAKEYDSFFVNTDVTETVESGTIEADASLVLKLYYDRVQYDITFDANQGTLIDSDIKTLKHGATVVAAPPTRTGYGFDGWFLDIEGTQPFNSIMPKQGITVYAHWTAGSVNFNVEHYIMGIDGKYPETANYVETKSGIADTSLTLETLHNDTYEVENGIVYNAAKVNNEEETTANISADGTLVVKLYYERKIYKLTWNLAAGTSEGGTPSGDVYFGTELIPPTLKKTGHNFVGWDKEVPNTMPAGNETYTAQWAAAVYGITYKDKDGASFSGTHTNPASYTYGIPVTLIAPEKAHHSFDGWFNNADCTGTAVTKITATDIGDKAFYAKWTANSFDITYVLNGGTNSDNPDKYTYGKGTPALLSPSKPGYTFSGWYTDASFNQEVSSPVISTEDAGNKTFYAKWTPISYTITYENLSKTTHTNPQTYTIETGTITLASPSERIGYTFAGWYDKLTEGNQVTQISAGSMGDRTVYARWTANSFDITYVLNGGTNGDNPNKYTYDIGVAALLPPSKAGYTFSGWYTDALLTQAAPDPVISKTDIGNKTFYAKWTAISYTITYENLSKTTHTNPLAYTIETGTITLASPSERTGYTFAGWYDKLTDGNQVTKINVGSMGDRTVYARWTANSYSISYILNGGTNGDNPTQYTYDIGVAALLPPSKTGYTFSGWYTDVSLTQPAPDPVISKTDIGNKIFYAKWTAKRYNLTYSNLYQMTHGNPLTYTIENTIILTPPSARTGYSFDGWFNALTGGSQVTQIDKGSMGDQTLYARWTALTYSISYILNGGTNADNPIEYTYEKGVGALLPPTQTGYDFGGWYTDTSCTQPVSNPVISSTDTGNKVFYAKWTLINYSITFDNLEGATQTNPASYTITSNDITLSAPTAREGYTFAGWYTDKTAGYRVTVITKGSTGNMVLYARWTANTYTITYNLAGGRQPNPANPTSYTVEDPTFALRAPVYDGYIFTGWTGSNGTTPQLSVEIPKGSIGAKTYIANWEAATWTVTYDMNGGKADSSLPTSFQVGKSLTLREPSVSSRPSPIATFICWKDTYTGQVVDTLYDDNRDYNLKAYWRDGSQSQPYQIDSQAGLEYLRNMSGYGKDKHFELAHSITVNGWNSYIPFSGHFDGRNFSITVSNFTSPLFGTLETTNPDHVFVENLNMYGTTYVGYASDFGFIARGLNSGIIKNCYVGITATFDAAYRVGGIVGNCSGKVINCMTGVNSFSLDFGGTDIGGIVGLVKAGGEVRGCYNYTNINPVGTYSNESLGGIAGRAVDSEINSCVNYGDINAAGTNRGGIVGKLSSETSTAKITWCKNFGDIVDSTNNKETAGGIAGFVYNSKVTTAKVENCVNHGILYGTEAGGIAGRINSNNAGSTLYITNCVNNVPTPANTSYGAIVGYGEGYCEVSKCYWNNSSQYNVKTKGVYVNITNCGTFDRTSSSPGITAGTAANSHEKQTLAYSGKNLVDSLKKYATDNNVNTFTWKYTGDWGISFE